MSDPYSQQQPQQWQPQPEYGPQLQQPFVWQPRTSGTATASLVFGIIGLLGGFLLFAIPNIVAVVLGHMATKEIRDSRGWIVGQGLATAGLVLGYVVLVPVGIFFIVGTISRLSI